jgi:hypothetical protein
MPCWRLAPYRRRCARNGQAVASGTRSRNTHIPKITPMFRTGVISFEDAVSRDGSEVARQIFVFEVVHVLLVLRRGVVVAAQVQDAVNDVASGFPLE